MKRRTVQRSLSIPCALLALGLGVLAVQQSGDTGSGYVEPLVSAWPLGLEPDFTLPADRIPTEDSIALGRQLFFDPRLSRDGRFHCGSCHDPERAFTDGRAVSPGVDGALGDRNTPSLVNRLFGREHFWDGRAATLAEQALGPLFSEREMAMDEESVLAVLHGDPDYVSAFQVAFGKAPDLDLLGRALEAFELTLVSGDSPFDRWEWEGDAGALDAAAQRGLALFRGKARCTLCHTGFNFTDESYHSLGLATSDQGRAAVSGREQDRFAFRTPSLRNVAQTSPYMHDGSLETLEDVIDFYDRGGGEGPYRSALLQALHLDAREKADLVRFLHSLTGPIVSLHPDAFSHAAHH